MWRVLIGGCQMRGTQPPPLVPLSAWSATTRDSHRHGVMGTYLARSCFRRGAAGRVAGWWVRVQQCRGGGGACGESLAASRQGHGPPVTAAHLKFTQAWALFSFYSKGDSSK